MAQAPDANQELQGQVALVTGAASGIGAATAVALASRGAHVVCADIQSSSLTLGKVREVGGQACEIHFDLNDRAGVTRAVAQAAAVGRIDILVAAAGLGFSGPLLASDEDWDRVIDTNLTGTYATLRAAWPMLQASGRGRVVLVTSMGAYRGGFHFGPQYNASKAGLIGLMRHFALHGGPDGIVVNAVAPGFIDTPFVAGLPYDAGAIALGRLGHPDDVAEPVAFLCSPAAAYVTGTVLHVNGGVFFG
jgi:NAD(P)-dependent dehydrogenase (short-subunit alcohol dehydrogenase family)